LSELEASSIAFPRLRYLSIHCCFIIQDVKPFPGLGNYPVSGWRIIIDVSPCQDATIVTAKTPMYSTFDMLQGKLLDDVDWKK
jgi:hypothetical protein